MYQHSARMEFSSSEQAFLVASIGRLGVYDGQRISSRMEWQKIVIREPETLEIESPSLGGTDIQQRGHALIFITVVTP